MKNEPSEQMWTRIDAFMIRAIELDPNIEPKDLGERVGNRYGYDLTENEVLTRLNLYKDADDNIFNYSSN